MTTTDIFEDLRLRILSGYPLLVLQTFEEQRWERALGELASSVDRGLVVWSATAGLTPPPTGDAAGETGPLAMLEQIDAYPANHLFLLKDLHPFLSDPRVVRKLRDMIPDLTADGKSLLLLGPVDEVPLELLKDVTVLELPLPSVDELRSELESVLQSDPALQQLEIDRAQEDHLVQAVLGLTAVEAHRAFARALLNCEAVDDNVYAALVSEKRRMVQGSDLLEFFELEEGLNDVGGLEGLKDWLLQRSQAFSTDASTRGISTPKGILLAGVQGCGKSLTARAVARLLGFPLVRLDFSNLLETTRGTSEQNLRDVLRVMETIAPSVLWLEEIDKAFAGFDDEASDDPTMSRIVGRFLTWLQEHEAPVFVVATANNVWTLPPELLRRGRFDELFFVDLPNYHERKDIFSIHLSKRGWKPEKYDVPALAEVTDGFSGAEIETIVNSAIIESWSAQRMLSQQDLEDAREVTVPLSVTMEDQIFELREWARGRCRPATPENRVAQMMEEEERRGEQNVADGSGGAETPYWQQLAEHGQTAEAIVEYVKFQDHVSFDRLIDDFGQYAEMEGTYGLVLRSDPKAVIWTRISRELADIISDYVSRKRLYLHPVGSAAYAGRRHPALEPIEELPDEKMARPAWLPMALRAVPFPGGSTRFGTLARIRLGRQE
ncbi:ATP-dependent zinc metalloprotease FtsH [Maioricimonas rarisocia]|uniref:Uncharacterized AAA domain-containing protein ycf46 n=1 Tax=Maioricimonas rarisocia TaxID=2528026 RepID=A0A517Z899_9PLAN|nr:AAA family ATPase [Maioricimonas rarisocia]QDU38661.1 ATP-dependent zinc metalloprotease FtsH [Maioricimonas rarisocia]